MDNLYQIAIANPTTEAGKAWNRWLQALDAHQEALSKLRETAQAVDFALNNYIKLKG